MSAVPSLSFLNTIGIPPSRFLKIISHSAISERVQKIGYSLLKAMSSLYLCSTGTAEILQNIARKSAPTKTSDVSKKVLTPSTAYLNLHGGVMVSSGCCSLFNLLHEFGVVNIGSIINAICTAGSVLFLCGNLFALEENVRVYNEIENTDWTKTNIDAKELYWLKQSAIFGILSNIGYIIATATLLFSGATAFAVLIATLSCLAGGVKILFDLYQTQIKN